MELTIEITNYCENECDYCSSNASKSGKYLSYDEIEKFIHENLKNVIHRINISGGEPLSHPDFYKILLLCKKYTRSVWVYTNAIEKIIYNSDVIKEIKVESNVCLIPLHNNSSNVEVFLPYLDGRLVNIFRNIPLAEKVDSENRKKIMFKIAFDIGVPKEIIKRNKYGFVDAFREYDK